jgi:RimJ/RimL family protein N-acetyltransferase
MAIVTTIDDLPRLRALAATLPDTPETVIALHTLKCGRGRVHIVGSPERYDALVIINDDAPGEPSCYGETTTLWSILRDLPGWFAANMREDAAPVVGAQVRRDWGEAVTYLGDPHFTLQQPAPELPNPDVRRLTLDDHPMLDAAPPADRGAGFGSTRALLEDGIVAAAVVNDAVVAIAHTSAMTDRHADIGVATLQPFRGRGYASAAAALVARAIQATGRTPVWSCGETNQASLRTARKVGFEPVLRRVYVIVESRRM